MSDTLTVAVLGTGIMGAGMARNLSAAGHDVRAWNRTAARAEPLAADGVRVVADPAQAVRGADAVVTMLLDGPATRAVVESAADALPRGAVWLQTGTVGPDAQAALAAYAAERGLLFVDAPVLGTRPVADAGQLTVLAAGPQAARAVADKVFDAVGGNTIWLPGDAADGPASRLKLVINNWVLALTAATGETLALAKALGVDPERFFEAIDGGALDNQYLRMKAAAILGGDFAPNFTVEGAAKDLRLIVAAGEAAGARLDLAAAGAARFQRAADQGHAAQDMSAAYFASFAP
ncbi:NAD(P)-dependent oxidoreductase [Actinacidiphila bryophytorum]|uniref:3-hydroxyisobutyrate dehydrogenase n=1 Tax=Actinacidiphila bryophytorum TaxID=1436133 RepID=A0A9W4E472_9ACTN|nr:NAD(P)-dependent oxidoreductase [Actinacidiphila bryophytorum]MBM9434695.1 NAD(P)-dependent oxidoreductase [Actinacidiphila bryophytorum]MBN6545973.1 NAD(P)-dependent oxidoreductase [Actinacidiphila bryophytorum]CAG7628979.1 3-hydroxyisobutyrate dehydrogenase [Actinacidiphila bryophytorum]